MSTKPAVDQADNRIASASLLVRLQEFAAELGEEDRAAVRELVGRSFDPLARMQLLEGDALFDEDELRVLAELDRAPAAASSPGRNRRRLRLL